MNRRHLARVLKKGVYRRTEEWGQLKGHRRTLVQQRSSTMSVAVSTGRREARRSWGGGRESVRSAECSVLSPRVGAAEGRRTVQQTEPGVDRRCAARTVLLYLGEKFSSTLRELSTECQCETSRYTMPKMSEDCHCKSLRTHSGPLSPNARSCPPTGRQRTNHFLRSPLSFVLSLCFSLPPLVTVVGEVGARLATYAVELFASVCVVRHCHTRKNINNLALHTYISFCPDCPEDSQPKISFLSTLDEVCGGGA